MASETLTVADYIEGCLLAELREVAKVNAPTLLVTGIVQAIESLGALLDDKPLKARDQSARRFRSAIRRLFPKRYVEVNRSFDLYARLRNQLTHVRLTSGALRLVDKTEEHLIVVADQLYIHPPTFLEHLTGAAQVVLSIEQAGKLPKKRIATGRVD